MTQLDTVAAHNALKATLDSLMSSPDQSRQIWNAETVKAARVALERQATEHHWEGAREILKQADHMMSGTIQWPRPSHWRDGDLPWTPPDIGAALAAVGLKEEETPFGPDYAQDEPRLRSFRFTEFVARTATPEPTIVYGADGVGKTAAALLLAAGGPDNQPFDKDAFPVMPTTANHLGLPMTSMDWLDVVSAAFARCQIRFLNINPYMLFVHERYRQAVLRLLVQHYGGIVGAVDAFPRESRGGIALRLAAEQEPLAAQFITLSFKERIALLNQTIPPDLKYAYVIVDQDLPDRDPLSPTVIDNLRYLMFLAPRLANKDIYLKIYLPREIRQDLQEMNWLHDCELVWRPEHLRTLLDNRFSAFGANFASISEPGDLEDLFIDLCIDSPRRMVRLGNRLLEKMGKAKRWRATEEDIREAAEEVERAG